MLLLLKRLNGSDLSRPIRRRGGVTYNIDEMNDKSDVETPCMASLPGTVNDQIAIRY